MRSMVGVACVIALTGVTGCSSDESAGSGQQPDGSASGGAGGAGASTASGSGGAGAQVDGSAGAGAAGAAGGVGTAGGGSGGAGGSGNASGLEGGPACTLVGCDAIARFEQALKGDADAVGQQSLTVCLNRDCATTVLGPLAVPFSGNTATVTITEGSAPVAVDVTLWNRGGAFAVEVAFSTQRTLADGDVYELWVWTDAVAQVAVTARYTATYETIHPNGEACPPSCKHATLTAMVPCCPIADDIGGCMYLGGSDAAGSGCYQACDFFCSTNWRVETDTDGCALWGYDYDASCDALDGGSDGDAG